ncbi:MAG: hypothetical protein QXI60_05145 [Thermofilaceae archaeon]
MVAFAALGYTSADPSASEGERFLAGLNALGRLLAVGSEWASYASMVPGRGGARAALREAGKEAGEKLARQGAKQAARNGDEWVRLYRAVEEEEYQQIRKLRRFASTVGSEVKHFTLSAEEAAAFARAMHRQTGKTYHIVYAEVRRRFVQFLPDLPDVLPAIRHAVVPLEYLRGVRPRILPANPIPWRWMR